MKRGAASELAEHRQTRRKRESEINRGLRELDEAGALAMLDQLCDQWQLGAGGPSVTIEEQTMRMFQQFGMAYRDNMLDLLNVDRGSFGLRSVDDKINDAELQAIGLYHRLHELGLLPEDARGAGDAEGGGEGGGGEAESRGGEDDPAKRDHLRRIVKVLEMVFYGKKVVLSAFQAKLAVHQLHLGDGSLDLAADLDARLGSWALRFRYIENKTTPMQNLLLYLLDGAMEKRYRKSGGWMYEPVYIDGKNTHAWRPVCEIKDFVYSLLHKETCWDQWCNATASGMKNIAGAIEYLTNCQDYQLPELHKQRGVYSFRNGVYMAREDRFHRFGEGEPLSEDVVACKFIDGDFVDYGDTPWRDIPTPHLQSIMDYQGFEPEVCRWMLVMLGRLLYPLNELDSWQVIPFFKGQASSGKCFRAGTRVLMYDGSARAVEAVDVGDLVMGDDGSPRRVLTLARGVDELFTLVPRREGDPSMTVTREHVLVLQCDDDVVAEQLRGTAIDRGQCFEMTVAEYLALPGRVRRHLVCYRVPLDFPPPAAAPLCDPGALGRWLGGGGGGGDVARAVEAYGLVGSTRIPRDLRTGSREARLGVLAGLLGALLDTGGAACVDGLYELTLGGERLADDVAFVARSLGFGVTKAAGFRVTILGAGPGHGSAPTATARQWGFDVVPAGAREAYYGFQTDGNQRFVLGDFTVTHNSTIIVKVCKSFYDAQDVGVLSNNIERKFGISAFWDKYIFLAPEVKSDLGIEQAEFQSVVSGEDLQVNMKHKKAFAVTWTVPGALAGNEVPSWADNSGSMQRRVILFEFIRSVTNGDMKLGEKLIAELAAILAKCNKAYLEAVASYSHVNIWTVLPKYFRETRDQLAQSVNSVEAFLASPEVSHGAELYCPMEDFRAALKTFEVSNNYRSKKYDTDFFRGPFAKYDLRIERAKKSYRGANKTRDYVMGIDINMCGEENELA